jgi:hypothetical protein
MPWEHLIHDEADLNRHIDYIHWNPVNHGSVVHVSHWPYLSFHRYVKQLAETAAHLGIGSCPARQFIEIPILYPSWHGAASVLPHPT